MPARDDALPLYVQTQGAVLGKSGERLTIKDRGKTLTTIKLKDVSQVCLFGNVQATPTAVGELVARGVPVCHFSYGGWFRAVTHGMTHKNVELRIAQFARAADGAASLELARRFVVGKIRNCRTLLRRHAGERLRFELNQLAEHVHKAEAAATAESLLGIEGMAAKIYFAGFGGMLKRQGEGFDLDGRNRRPPKDPVNAMLSFVYALLVKELAVEAQAVGFDPMLGFYHRPRYGRPSLALDLAEEFRPLIGDSVVLTLVNNGEVSPSSFVRRAGAVALTDAGRRAVLAAFERRLESEVTHPLFGYRVSYRRILEVQTRLLARTLLGELAEYPNFCTR
jgi:CRISPR-associated protein Cas1